MCKNKQICRHHQANSLLYLFGMKLAFIHHLHQDKYNRGSYPLILSHFLTMHHYIESKCNESTFSKTNFIYDV